MTEPTPDPAAPHGRDESGKPLTPYGVNRDGSPRKSNRGARPGQVQGKRRNTGRPTAPTVSTSNLTDEQRKAMLVELADMAFVSPLAAASQIPVVAKFIGPVQADALAGDAVIVSHFMPSVADGLILLSQTKPRTLAWLDKAEENAPWILLANVGVQVAKAFVSNHMNPDPKLASAGRLLAAMRMAQVAERIEQEAAAYGLVTEPQGE